MLKVLASQAAISLENGRLYSDLKTREAKIRRLIEANVIGICIWNFDGNIIEANEAFLNMLGYEREDISICADPLDGNDAAGVARSRC